MLRTLARTATRAAATTSRTTALVAVRPRPSPSSSLRSSASTPRFASSTTPHSSTMDPQELAAQEALDQGTDALAKGDFQTALSHYQQSVDVKKTAIGYYNLGVVQYQLRDLPSAIRSFELSIEHTPAGVILADTHTNLGAAYILSSPAQPDKALEHLQKALMINPDDGEVCYNLAAVLEATGELDEALIAYERAQKLGIARAELNVKNVSSKILGKQREEAEKAKAGGSVAATDATASS